jgi:two-component system NtrC family response regulator
VDDDTSLRRVIEYELNEEGYDVTAVPGPPEALDALRSRAFDLVLSDILMPGMDGIELLARVKAMAPETVVVMITAHGTVETAVKAMQNGAFDFLLKPFSGDRLRVAVRKALEVRALFLENRVLREAARERYSFENIVGTSPAMRQVFEDVSRAAESDATVLLTGESGTGKELFARALHFNSRRRKGPFVTVNFGAIPETLVESELFGYRKGAFTGATEDRTGKFEAAHRGTVFLDEIGEIPLALQPKILRVLQEGEVDRLGATSARKVDFRVVAATNRDLEALVAEGRFREDLYYRVHVIPIRLPPLRERREDIPLLVEHFLLKHARKHERKPPRLAPEVFARFDRHDWPGNVRELENLIERIVVLSRGDVVGPELLPLPVSREGPRYGGLAIDIPEDGLRLEEVERALLQEALRRHGGNQSRAARFLGISRQTLIYRMQKHELR